MTYKYTSFFLLLFTFFLVLPAHAQEITTSTSDITTTTDTTTLTTTTDEVVSSTSSTEPIVYEVNTSRELIDEPTIRVGLKKTKEVVSFVSDQTYEVVSGGVYVDTLPFGETAKLSYKKGKYFLKSASLDLVSDTFWRLEPVEDGSIFNIPGCKISYTGRKMTYCAYRGILEYRYGPKSKMPYLINELPVEDYMKGIAETDNNSAEGYIKAVLVAARSYAYKNISFAPPTDKWLFDVYATTQDQLYLGYTSEVQMPRVAQFADETAGEMVTYNDEIVTTPYFTHTNGVTKDWKNSAGVNDRPWLSSVECIYDKYKKYSGHGIGMSTHDALMRATKDDWGYVQLLTYYYSNTQVEKIY